jgi:hypothetical protein
LASPDRAADRFNVNVSTLGYFGRCHQSRRFDIRGVVSEVRPQPDRQIPQIGFVHRRWQRSRELAHETIAAGFSHSYWLSTSLRPQLKLSQDYLCRVA